MLQTESRSALGRDLRVLVLRATRRDGAVIGAFLERRRIAAEICTTASAAVAGIREGIGALVLCDQLPMPEESHLITEALMEQPSWSDVPVIFLSKIGAESRSVLDVVNRLTNVTLLDRPTSLRTLASAIQTALRARAKQYQMRDQWLALKAAERELRESDRQKDEFLAMLAHELRNPLAPIRTAADLLPRVIQSVDPRATAALGVMNRQIRQLTRLVDDLLDVSRLTQGRIEIERGPVALCSVIDQALESIESQARDKHHRVIKHIAPGLFVEGDRTRLVQCVSNLLANAVKYTDQGGTIEVSVAGENAWADIAVADNGIGITPGLLPRVFDLFVQDARSLDRSQGGLGIGLNVVRRLVEMQGGTVGATSAGAGWGSVFRIRLPLIAPPVSPPPGGAHAPPPNSIRVLIVDDNRDAADALCVLLRHEGHRVQTAYDGTVGLARAAAFLPDLILLDIGLPSLDGYEVARRLRSGGSRATLVALTGYGQREDVERALGAGFDAHITKPVELPKLETALQMAAAHGSAAR